MVVTLAGVTLEPLESQAGADCHRFGYEQDTTDASMAVVAALSAVSETDPLALPPLYVAVETDALDALMSERGADSDAVAVSLQLAGYTVTVYGDGEIAVSPSATQRAEDRTGAGCQL